MSISPLEPCATALTLSSTPVFGAARTAVALAALSFEALISVQGISRWTVYSFPFRHDFTSHNWLIPRGSGQVARLVVFHQLAKLDVSLMIIISSSVSDKGIVHSKLGNVILRVGCFGRIQRGTGGVGVFLTRRVIVESL
jgi:hypothetical protein